MPSKGIDVYSYISAPDCTVQFSVPGTTITHDSSANFTTQHLEVEHDKLPSELSFVGRFSWSVFVGDTQIDTAYNDINTLTGNLAGGDMRETVLQQSRIFEDQGVIVNYGFYQAGHGEAGLTNHNQCYVTVVPLAPHVGWMGQLAPRGSSEAQKPFSRFVLAAPHDDGMNSMQSVEAVLQNCRDEKLVAELEKHIPAVKWLSEHMSHKIMVHMLPNIIYGVAITQKDTIPTLLALGARYFEFRPADLMPAFQDAPELMKGKPHFQHACIPGLAFEEFLHDLSVFLDDNQEEIVVNHIRWDNVMADCKRPTEEEMKAMYDEACRKAKSNPLKWGGAECFSKSIDELRESGTRIILVVDVDKYDSWTADAYRTLSAAPILERFEGMNTEGQMASDITVLQCQATSQSIKEVLIYSVLASGADTSCLTSTKAALDIQTLPWIRDNALERLQAERTLVIMNDFLDGATTDVMLELNRKRLALP